MHKSEFTRRTVLKGSTALPRPRCSPSRSAPRRRPPAAITPALIEAAKKEGKVSFYTAMDLHFAEPLGKAFEEKFPASRCASSAPAPSACSRASARSIRRNIHAVDVVNTADAAHCIVWKRNGWLAAVPAGGGRAALRQGSTTIRTAVAS